MQPGSPDFDSAGFEALLLELSVLTGWTRERVLAGLGFGASEAQDASPPNAG